MATTRDGDATVSPPAGIGAAPGLGEAFRLNLSTGQGVYSYKIALPDGVAGHTPTLALQYTQGTRFGPFGFGWQLPVRAIDQRLDLGVPGQSPATFLDGGSEIVALADGTYAARVESAFARYSREGDGWKIEERDGSVYELGTTPAARIADPGQPSHVQTWLLERWTDVSGNVVTYSWDVSDGIPYLLEVGYAAYAVRLAYEDRPDARRDGRAGFVRSLRKRCARIDLVLDPGASEAKLRSWSLDYTVTPQSGISLLSTIQLQSFGTSATDGGTVTRPPVTFAYGAFDPADVAVEFWTADAAEPPALDDPDVALVTLDSAPLPGILEIAGGEQFYWRNNGGGWDFPQRLTEAPFGGSIASAGAAFIDVNGNGKADLMLLAPGSVPGYFENAGQLGWGDFVAYPRNESATPDWLGGRLRFSDNDADGRVDAIESLARGYVLWRNGGDSGWGEAFFVPAPPDGGADFANALVQLADMTGDGASDIVEITSGAIRYWQNLGNGRFADGVWMDNAPHLRDLQDAANRVYLTDIDGDGCADLVFVGDEAVTVAINRNGAAFADSVFIAPIPSPIPSTIRVVNLKGTATAGLLWNSYCSGARTGYVHLGFNASSDPYLLASIENGSGLFSELFYRSAVDEYLRDRAAGTTWDTNFPFPLRVVAETRETDRVTGVVSDVLYQYHDAHYQPSLRSFEGFRVTEKIEKGDESRADTKTVHRFLMAMELLPGNTIDDAALNGCLAQIDVYGLDGSLAGLPLSTEQSEYTVDVMADPADGSHRTYVKVAVHRTLDSERSSDARCEEQTYTYDDVGNVVREVQRAYGTKGGVAQTDQIRTSEIAYATSTTRRLLGKPSRVVTRDGSGNILSEEQLFYDGADFVGLPFGQADRGLLTRRLRKAWSQADFSAHYDASMDGATALGFIAGDDADGAAAQFVAAERHAYDARGLKAGDMDPIGVATTFAFDAPGLLRTSLSGPLGTTTFTYDRGVAQPSSITYPNGEAVQFKYDAEGRLRWSLTPVDESALPPRTYAYDNSVVPNVRTVRMLQTKAGDVVSSVLTFFDARGNELQHRAQSDAATYVVSGYRAFNPWGDLKTEFEPTFSSSAAFSWGPATGAASRSIAYDARGRVVRTVDFNGGVSTAQYLPFSVEIADANDNDTSSSAAASGQANTPRREQFDVSRQRMAIEEVLGGGQMSTTTYVNDPLGRMIAVQDALGSLCSYKCDLLGNRYEVDHRSAGLRKLWYDARNHVVRSLDANGNDLRATLDAVGRLQRLTSAGNVLEEYTYEAAGADAVNLVASATFHGGSQSFQYDAAGRLSQIVYAFDGVATPHTVQFEYDVLGREVGQVHSDGVTIGKSLSFNGWVTGIANVLSSVTYNPRGLAESVAFANGVTTTMTYLAGPGRVKSQRTVGRHGEAFEDLAYAFDPMGRLLSNVDSAPAGRGTTTYAYDPLYQITSYSSGDPSQPTVRNYSYTNFLNLTKMDETGSTFAYDDAAHPDRIAGVSTGGAERANLSYDADGNLLGFGGNAFTYNEKSELAKVVRGDGLTAVYAYDPQGRRVSKQVTLGGIVTTTLFAGTDVEIRNGQTVHFVELGGRRVALLSSGATKFMHSDYAGNTAFFSDASGSKLASIVYRPFGNVDSANGDVSDRTYGLHPFDSESGLYYMGRRYYAAALARFLTPDPMALYQPDKVVGNPKALHPYAYAGSDPLNNLDFDGLSFWSVVGAIVGVVAAVGIIALTVATGGLAGVVIGVVLSLGLIGTMYVAASANAGTGPGEFFRGFMIGFNAAMNVGLGALVWGPGIGLALGVINFLAAFNSISGNKVYQGILGWSSWLMPMSWGVTLVGLVVTLINLVAAGVTWNGSWFSASGAKIDSISVDWGTGTIVMTGGWIRAPSWAAGFNLGNFAYLDPGSSAQAHETGHTLVNAAFGSIFNAYSAIDDSINHTSYGEHLAESHTSNPANPDQGTWWHMWGPG
jgi:RHS repeat-associated protein